MLQLPWLPVSSEGTAILVLVRAFVLPRHPFALHFVNKWVHFHFVLLLIWAPTSANMITGMSGGPAASVATIIVAHSSWGGNLKPHTQEDRFGAFVLAAQTQLDEDITCAITDVHESETSRHCSSRSTSHVLDCGDGENRKRRAKQSFHLALMFDL